MRLLTLAAPACALAFGLTLTACGESETETKDTDTGDYLSGSVDEWMEVACDGAATAETDKDSNEGRGKDATHGLYCLGQYDQGTDADGDSLYSYAQAYFYDSDQAERISDQVEAAKGDGERFVTVAWGQVSADEWVVISEDGSGAELREPHLEDLADFGFTVVVNNVEV